MQDKVDSLDWIIKEKKKNKSKGIYYIENSKLHRNTNSLNYKYRRVLGSGIGNIFKHVVERRK